eukprot:403363616
MKQATIEQSLEIQQNYVNGGNLIKTSKSIRGVKITHVQMLVFTLMALLMQATQVQSIYGKILSYDDPLLAVYSQVENSTDPDLFTINIESTNIDISKYITQNQKMFVAYTMIFGVISQASGYDQIKCMLKINDTVVAPATTPLFTCKDEKVDSNGEVIIDSSQDVQNVQTILYQNTINPYYKQLGNYKVQFQRGLQTTDTTNDYQFLNPNTVGSQSIQIIYEFGHYDANNNEVVDVIIQKPYTINLMDNAMNLATIASFVISITSLLFLAF